MLSGSVLVLADSMIHSDSGLWCSLSNWVPFKSSTYVHALGLFLPDEILYTGKILVQADILFHSLWSSEVLSKTAWLLSGQDIYTIFLIWAPLSTWTRLFHFLGNYTEWGIFLCTPETYYSPLLVRCIVHPNLVDSCVLVLTHIQKEHSALTLAVHLLWGLSILVSTKRELIFFCTQHLTLIVLMSLVFLQRHSTVLRQAGWFIWRQGNPHIIVKGRMALLDSLLAQVLLP